MLKKTTCLLISLLLLFSISITAYAGTKDSVQSSKPYNVTMKINGKDVKVTHKDAPAPSGTSILNDPPLPWQLSMHSVTSSHFQQTTVTIIAASLAGLLGGWPAFYVGISANIAGAGVTEFTGDVYEDVYYYWVPSSDPELPYYVKQYIVYYRNSNLTDYVGSTTRYYYSDLPY